jgi:hypothetical protein
MQVSHVHSGEMTRSLRGALIDLPPGSHRQVGHEKVGVEDEEGVGDFRVQRRDEPVDFADLPPVDVPGDEKRRGREGTVDRPASLSDGSHARPAGGRRGICLGEVPDPARKPPGRSSHRFPIEMPGIYFFRDQASSPL